MCWLLGHILHPSLRKICQRSRFLSLSLTLFVHPCRLTFIIPVSIYWIFEVFCWCFLYCLRRSSVSKPFEYSSQHLEFQAAWLMIMQIERIIATSASSTHVQFSSLTRGSGRGVHPFNFNSTHDFGPKITVFVLSANFSSCLLFVFSMLATPKISQRSRYILHHGACCQIHLLPPGFDRCRCTR